ncbi:MAG: hypothetical protein ACRYHB_08115 [Janthinobacterium lividum]
MELNVVASARTACTAAMLLLPCSLLAQQPAAPSPVSSLPALIDEAVTYQLRDMRHEDSAVRYKVHRVDGKEDTLRDLIETKNGNVARTLQRNGARLTAEEDALEQRRLRDLTPDELERRRKREETSERYGAELVTAMPRAMIYTFTPDQPQLLQYTVPQTVLDYAPDPAFQPATTAQTLLAGLTGRIWLDKSTHHLLRLEVHITKNLNLAFGLLARVYQGGSMVYEQVPLGNGYDAYRHLEINVTMRELMVKTVPYHSTFDATDLHLLPSVPSLHDAVEALLAGAAR